MEFTRTELSLLNAMVDRLGEDLLNLSGDIDTWLHSLRDYREIRKKIKAEYHKEFPENDCFSFAINETEVEAREFANQFSNTEKEYMESWLKGNTYKQDELEDKLQEEFGAVVGNPDRWENYDKYKKRLSELRNFCSKYIED